MTAQPPRMLGTDDALDRITDEIVEAVQRIRSHGAVIPRATEISPVG